MANNFTRFDQGIQLANGFATDPVTGQLGESYYNTTKNVARMCVKLSPLTWEDMNIRNGTVQGSMLAFDTTTSKFLENLGLVLSGYTMGGQPDTVNNGSKAANATFYGANKTAGTGDGGDAILAGGSSAGGNVGRAVLNGDSVLIGANHASDPTVQAAGEFYYNSASNRFRFYNGTVWQAIGAGNGGIYPVNYVDNYSTVLPTSAPYAPDVSPNLVSGDQVLFTALTAASDHGVYQATITGPVISWVRQVPGQSSSGVSVIGDFVWASAGVVRAKRMFVCTNTGSATWMDYVAFMQNGSLIEVTLYDPIDTTRPTSANPVVDGITVTDGMTVLFSGLTGGEAGFNNQVFVASNSAVTPVWTAVSPFPAGVPAETNTVVITDGIAFIDQIGKFNGTTWVFNDKMRYFNGADYWEQSALFPFNIPNNSSGNVFSIAALGSENMIVDYSLQRGTVKVTGQLYITQDTVTGAIADGSAQFADVGITFDAVISGSNIELTYLSDNSGFPALMKYSIKRWSDNTGGPAGPPSYTGFGSEVTASGPPVAGQIPFWTSSSNLTGVPALQWDNGNEALLLGNLGILALQDATMLDNQSAPALLFTMPATFKHAFIEYSISRNGDERVGMWMLVNNGVIASISDDWNDTADVGVLDVSADVNAGLVRVFYTSSSTGFDGAVQYNVRRWS